MIMRFSLFSKSEKISLLLHISNDGISAGLVAFMNGQKPKIKYSQFISCKTTGKTQKSSISDTLEKTLASVVKFGSRSEYKHISSILISFSPPLFYSKVAKIEINKDRSFVVSQNFLSSILKYETHCFEDFLSKSITPEITDSFTSIESIFTGLHINGYFIPEYINQKTKNLSSDLYISAISKSFQRDINTLIFKHLPSVHNIQMYSFSFISYALCQNIFPALSSVLLLNITSETTDIILISDKSISKTISFQSGRNFIIRQIAKKFDVSPEIAESYLHMRNNKTADENLISGIKTVLDDIENEWIIYFENAISEISANTTALSDICLIAKDDTVNLYLDFLINQKNNKEFLKNAKFFCLNKEVFSDKYDTIGCEPDIFISAMTVFNTV